MEREEHKSEERRMGSLIMIMMKYTKARKDGVLDYDRCDPSSDLE